MDEKQLQFLYNEYAKSKGFKDYSEFKGLMSSEGSRKLFFDDANKELGFKDYNEFSDLLGLKKKVGGEISSPTELPSVSREYLDKGQELADGSFLKKIGEPDRSKLVSQYESPDISLIQKPKKDYYSTKLEKGLIFDKEGQLYAPSSEALSKDITAAEQASLKKSTQKDLVEKSRQMPVVEPTEEQGLLLNLVSSLDRGFAKNFISNPMKGLGTFLQGTTKKVLGGSGEGDLSNALIKYGDYLNNAIDELTPQDEEFKDTLWDQAAQALGQVGSLVLTGGLTGASGKAAALVAQAPKGAVAAAASRLASQLSAPTSISAGLSIGQAEFDRAKQAGATDDQAFEAFYKNAVTGSVLETIPVMQFFKRFNKSTAGGLVNYLKTKGVAGFTGGVEEMTTEILQQLYANKTAKDIYNINQSILDGVGTSGGIGFGVGFLLNAMGANARILRKQGKTQDAIAIENQIEQYEDNLKNPKVTSGNTAKDIVTQGIEIGTQKAVQDLDRDLANNVITPEKYQEGIAFAEKAAQVADKIPETVIGESRVKSVELLVERNDIKQANDNLIQQKQSTDEAYHAGIDEEIKANEERIKKIDSEVYNIAKKPSKDFGGKKYILNGEEVSQAEFEALQGKPIGTKEIITAEVKPEEVKVTEEVKPTEVKEVKPIEFSKTVENKYGITVDLTGNVEKGDLTLSRIEVPKEQRGKEIGTKAMEDIIKYADENNKRIVLTPSTDFGGTSVERLKEFYKKFGFIENIGKNKDFTTKETMYRNPEVKPTEVKEEVKVEVVKPEVKKSKLEAYKAKYAPKPKEKIEPIKIEDNGKPIIAKDPAENDIAIAKLAKQDNPVEESSIKAIEGKAEGDIKAKLNEVIAEVDDKIKLATRIEMVGMNDLKTDEASFQNREGLNLKKVDDIVANYNPSEFDPIIYWTDASGQKYTLNHHRFAAAQKLKLDEIPAQKLTYPLGHPKEFQVVPATDKAEAIDFAINRSNANRSMETAVERAKALRKLQKTGTKEEVNKFLEREGKNKTKIQNIAALNENGKTIDALKMFGDAEDVQLQKETEQRSDWIGEARRRISGLTNEHENEMFDFLMDKDASKRITSKADFISKVTSLAGGFDFNPENPLNLKRFKYQTEGERAYDEITGQLKSEIDTRQTKIDDLKARFSDPSRKDYIPTDSRDYEQTKKIADDQISKLNTEIKSFQQKLQEHYKEKGKYQGGIEQGGLFATKQITTEEISEMADIVKEFYDEGVIKLDDIKKEVAKELGYNSKALKDAVEQAYNKMVMEYTPVEISKGVIGKVGEKLNELGEEGIVMLEDDQSIFAKAAQLEQEGGKIDYDLKEANEQAKEIELEKDKNGNLIAPNGKKSNLNEVQWKLVRTPAFKNWAGEKWESILKDDNGEPRVVYHGTFSPNPKYGQQDFYTFSRKWSETNDTGFHFGTKEAAEARIADLTELSKKGYLFARDTERPRMLPVFLKTGNVLRLPEDDRLPDWRGYRIVQKIFDGIENGTLDKSAEKAFEKDIDKFYDDKLLKSYPENKPEKENKWIGDYLKKKGYDAIEYSNVVEDKGKDSYIVFRPEQVKLADGSNTTFGESGDIRFQYGKERIDSLINNIKINGQDISELLNYVVDSNDLLRRLDYLNKGINRNIELSKAIKDEKLSNPLKELRIGLLKYMDSEIEYRNNELKNAKQKGILNKDGDISDLKSRKIASYEKRLEKLKFYKDFIDNNLFNIKDLEINFKNIQYGKENLAPNGKKSNLTPEQYVLVRTPNFKKWFGDWENDPENASKVIDENGEPLVVYHGSIAPDIEVFDRELSKRKPSGLREMGFYFTTNKELAEFYSTAPAKEGAKNIKSKVYQSFLNLKTVKEFDAKGKNGLRAWDQLQVDAGYKIAQNRDAMDFLQNGKFGVDKVDGIIARNISDMESYGAVGVNEKFNGTVFLVFDDNKNSIKSATDNTGAFSTTDDRINYMAKPSGDILGFTYGKTIYLNASKINPNTPIHEGGHIWTKWVKNNDPRLYDRGMELVKNSKYLERAKSSKFYQEQAAKLPQGEREAYFQEEALAMAIGDKGAQFVAESKKNTFKEWLDNLWDAIKNAAGFDNITAKELQNLTFDEFVKRAARDILSPKSQQELASINEGMAEAYKDLTINQKRQIINSKFDELLRVLKIEKICP